MVEVAKGTIGPEFTYDVELKDGAVSLVGTYKGADATASLTVSIGAEKLIDHAAEKLKTLIPGKIDDGLIDLAANALKSAMK